MKKKSVKTEKKIETRGRPQVYFKKRIHIDIRVSEKARKGILSKYKNAQEWAKDALRLTGIEEMGEER